MTTVTSNDVRALAVSGLDHPVLALIDDAVEILPAADVPEGARVIYTREALNRDLGDEVTDIEVDLTAGRLTALVTVTPAP
ncbi:hypothetical protein GCM10009682_31460 [Luedemannella flava]|uniref:Halobacterial output domain-containing protein n=1 Tax=Luedemannella flava TaxID=349316 RepID=A0ABN2M2V4_9ACTN